LNHKRLLVIQRRSLKLSD